MVWVLALASLRAVAERLTGRFSMQDPGYGLPRIYLLETVRKGARVAPEAPILLASGIEIGLRGLVWSTF